MGDSLKWIYESEMEEAKKESPPPAPIEPITMYQCGSTDGYTHTHGGPLYATFAAAKFAGEKADGGYAVDPKPVQVIVLGDVAYIVQGTAQTIDQVEIEREMRAAALAKLTPQERKLLGL